MDYQFKVSGKTRKEHDLLGGKEVPVEALFGIQTLRCIENFQISGHLMYEVSALIKAFGLVKMGAILANHKEGLVSDRIKDAVVQACQELIDGKHHDQFPIDMIQGGAGTSTNMNANEVIANRALELMGYKRGDYAHCSPNDHVNCSQSTNDTYPTAIHIGLYYTYLALVPHFEELIRSFERKAKEFAGVIKMGRTQWQDAVPMTLGQTFAGFASILRNELPHLEAAARELLTINIGATAIGTGICAEPGYAEKSTAAIAKITGHKYILSDDLVGATSDTSSLAGYSSALRMIALKMNKICNDLRLLSSGPRCGLNEINLPPMQPGSSIMPGKVNPVIAEVVGEACYEVMGNDVTIMLCSERGEFELNAFEPGIAYALFNSIFILENAMKTLAEKAIRKLTANPEACLKSVLGSVGIVTAFNPYIGYEKSASIAKEALQTGKAVGDICLERGYLKKEEIDKILEPKNMLNPHMGK